jgi:hypothetical protein
LICSKEQIPRDKNYDGELLIFLQALREDSKKFIASFSNMKLKQVPESLIKAYRLSKLTYDALHWSEHPTLPVIISLTSIPSRFHILHLAIRSMLHQTQAAEKVILWLHESHRGRLPKKIMDLIGPRFEVAFVPLDCPHIKLVYALKRYPEKIIITCDDDLLYHPELITRLYQSHNNHPNDIIANQCRQISYDQCGKINPYLSWPNVESVDYSSEDLLALGYAGILYPAHCLHPDATNDALFSRLTPKADDLWFKCMATINGTKTRRSANPTPNPRPIIGSQKISLKSENVHQDKNRLQWQDLANYYNLEITT